MTNFYIRLNSGEVLKKQAINNGNLACNSKIQAGGSIPTQTPNPADPLESIILLE